MFVTEIIDQGDETVTVYLVDQSSGEQLAAGSGFCISGARKAAQDDLSRQLDHWEAS